MKTATTPQTLPIGRGAMAGVCTYHRYLIQDTVALTTEAPVSTGLVWHNELDRVYFQCEWLNTGGLAPISLDVHFDLYLRIDNLLDTQPYDSFLYPLPVSANAPEFDARTFPIGGSPMLGSIEYMVQMSIDPGTVPGADQNLFVRLWGIPELWYTFRQVIPSGLPT